MKELLVKDYRLLLTQKKSLFTILVFGLFMMCIDGFDKSFLVGYMMIISVILSAGTINFDEMDNGMSFIMTLPASRKTYAVEKYVLSFLNALFCDVVILAIYLISKGFISWGMNTRAFCLAIFNCMGVMGMATAVLLPLYLKYSVEKRRVAIVIISGIAAASFYALGKIVDSAMSGKGLSFIRIFITTVSDMNPVIQDICGALIIITCVAISMFISIRIMQKKEF